jgi:hypothetical protein
LEQRFTVVEKSGGHGGVEILENKNGKQGRPATPHGSVM